MEETYEQLAQKAENLRKEVLQLRQKQGEGKKALHKDHSSVSDSYKHIETYRELLAKVLAKDVVSMKEVVEHRARIRKNRELIIQGRNGVAEKNLALARIARDIGFMEAALRTIEDKMATFGVVFPFGETA